MQTFYKRLFKIIENQGFKNLNDFALNGLKYDSSSKLNRLKDDNNKPSVEILLDISNKFQNINLHWLITGEGKMLLKEEIFEDNIVKEPPEIYKKEEEKDLIMDNNALLRESNVLLREQNEILKARIKDIIKDLEECKQQKNILSSTNK